MTEEVQQRTEGKTPYDWQLDIAEAFYLGVDSVIIAGTGAGKTLPFTMALLADSSGKSKIMIISTLFCDAQATRGTRRRRSRQIDKFQCT